jgi:hypothetical protein
MFGLFLFFFAAAPLVSVKTALAAETGEKKSEAYRLNVYSIVLAKGQTYTLRTYNVGEKATIYFKSGDEEIASVSDDGLISAKKVGSTAITVTIKDGSDVTSLSCDVSVGPAAVSVKWTQSIVILGIDSINQLNVILKPSNTVENAKFTSLNSDIVSVTPRGRASAKNYGYAELRAYINDTNSDGSQKYDSCGIIVTSSDNVSKLSDYFNEHTELNQISKDDLLSALDKFFNKEFDQTSSSNLISSLDRYLNNTFKLR